MSAFLAEKQQHAAFALPVIAAVRASSAAACAP
jgi:hypothetical protein